MSQLTTRLVNDTPDAAMVQTRDRNDVDHRIAIDKATGEIAVHQYNDYPGTLEECTPDQRRLIRAARASARYTVQAETDADVVRPTERPAKIRAGIRIVDDLPDGEFVRYFRGYYDEIREPSAAVPDNVTSVTSILYLDDDETRLEYVTSPTLELETRSGTHWQYTNPADTMAAPDRDPDVLCRLEPQSLAVSFGDPFRSLLVDHLRCQIRDIYWLRGETIPEDCRLEGAGNPDVDRVRSAVEPEAVSD
ncbi:hypothetical protein OB955_00635 [Halobacteria archaeon AArc-m2/3/4]|uniref:Uncharacterized protein n=1 Tax=Natronoglomus mannanivorans TaxID=2979990 RepID=A0ABT2Q8K6_9EURY|nr:hypothetical protein [Halobacteria archaeon AArc-m2/3/4]